jgi:hypothetical protein
MLEEGLTQPTQRFPLLDIVDTFPLRGKTKLGQAGAQSMCASSPGLPAYLPLLMQRSTMAVKTHKPIPPIAVSFNPKNPEQKWYMEFPRAWVDAYFGHITHFEDGRKGDRIPSSFWKYLLYLWRWLSLPRDIEVAPRFYTEVAAKEFPVRPPAATQWTAAFAVSGVVQVRIGKYTPKHDVPTLFTYNPKTSHLEWQCFFEAVAMALGWIKANKWKIAGNTGGWKVLVAIEVDERRVACGLPAINQQFFAAELKRKTKLPCIEQLQGGIQPVFYKPRHRQHRLDEPYEDFESAVD